MKSVPEYVSFGVWPVEVHEKHGKTMLRPNDNQVLWNGDPGFARRHQAHSERALKASLRDGGTSVPVLLRPGGLIWATFTKANLFLNGFKSRPCMQTSPAKSPPIGPLYLPRIEEFATQITLSNPIGAEVRGPDSQALIIKHSRQSRPIIGFFVRW
jgi:hypothetical protein